MRARNVHVSNAVGTQCRVFFITLIYPSETPSVIRGSHLGIDRPGSEDQVKEKVVSETYDLVLVPLKVIRMGNRVLEDGVIKRASSIGEVHTNNDGFVDQHQIANAVAGKQVLFHPSDVLHFRRQERRQRP